MKIAITGGSGFVGRHLARTLVREGHEVVLIARGLDERDVSIRKLEHARFCAIGTDDETKLIEAFDGCAAVAHCAGINRETATQTYQRVHVEGTRHVINAAHAAGVRKIALMSFLRARPDCGSAYHESKWEAERILRAAGLDYTIFKAGLIYGTGDHMLDHLSHAFHTFPIFPLVGMRDRLVRPVAVEDVVRLFIAALVDGRLSKQTVAVTGPEELTFGEAVGRVARIVGKHPLIIPAPVFFHQMVAWCAEQTMTVPLISKAQVQILAEGVVEVAPAVADAMPDDLAPRLSFTDEQIERGLPTPQGFG